MSAQARGHWAGIGETTFVGGMRLLYWVCRVAGRWPFRVLLYPVLLWYVATSARGRAASQAYLRRVAAFKPVATGWLGVLRHFASFAETILDKMLLWGGAMDLSQVRFVGLPPMLDLLAQRRGALLVCSHLGNTDLCRVLSHQVKDLKLTVLVHTRHAEAFNGLLAALDPRSQLDLVQVTEMSPATAMMLSERVARGEFVVIAGDRVPVGGGRHAIAPFLGSPAPFPVGPYILAAVLQCPVYAMFSLQSAGGPEVHFELLREAVRLPRKDRKGGQDRDERDGALAALAAQYAARLEHHCLQAPLQWFNFYDFWDIPALDKHDASC
jgi:predicted LPLAT superfamily acyltransferase